MENTGNIFSSLKYAEVRIDLAKNFPVTVYGDSTSGRKSRKLLLADIIAPEDLPTLIHQIEVILAGKQNLLQTHARIKTDGEYAFFLIMCGFKREKFGRSHLEGFVFDVHDYLGFKQEDRALLEYIRKDEQKAELIKSRELTLGDIIEPDYLRQIQMPLADGGVYSVIFDDGEKLLCSPQDSEKGKKPSDYMKLKHTKSIDITVNRVVAARWLIAAPSADLITKNTILHDTLAQAITKIANSFAMLYNEMNNSEHANKLLSQHIEQQILTNNVYNLILERKDASEALGEVIKLVGEYMGMRRIRVYTEDTINKCFDVQYEWKSLACPDTPPASIPYTDIEALLERLKYSDMYIPAVVGEEDGLKPEACTIANLTGDGKRFGVMVFAPSTPGYVPTAQESKVLRSVAQITATLMLRKQADDKLQDHAFFDQVLRIPNRTSLDYDLTRELISGTPGAAVAVKITNLHTFNELFGHTYTDGMLRETAWFASEMQEMTEITGTTEMQRTEKIPVPEFTVYRFSGNTLMIILRNTDEQGAKSFVTELLARFADPWRHENGEHYLDAGVGIALYPNELATPDEIYRAADLALYKATEYGTNSYAFYTEEFKKAAGIDYYHAEKLRDAVMSGMKGFYLRYQPMSAVSGDGNSTPTPRHEVFVNWDFLPTTKLMQLAENAGLDVIIDSWVIKNACLFCKKMQEYEPDFSISVNITPRGLRSGSIIGIVSNALSESGLDGSSLAIEIPERVFSDRQDGVLRVLNKLRLLGVKLVIDSFGADYGGLRFLKHSLMDMVKMDFSLFTNIFGEFDEIWVGAAAKLASSLKNGICVKRVEDEAQLKEARKFGVTHAQGFLFAKPVTGDEIAKKLQKGAKVK